MKVKVSSFSIYWNGIISSEETIDLKCMGKGTITNPFIITPETNPPKTFKIFSNSFYILVKNIDIGGLTVYKSQNISIIDSAISSLGIFKSRNCFIESGKTSIEIVKSKEIVIKGCEIGILRLKKAHNCKIINNDIENLIVKKSSNNVFESNKIIEES